MDGFEPLPMGLAEEDDLRPKQSRTEEGSATISRGRQHGAEPVLTAPSLATRSLPRDVAEALPDWYDVEGAPFHPSDRLRYEFRAVKGDDSSPMIVWCGINPSGAGRIGPDGNLTSDATRSAVWEFSKRAGFKRDQMLNLCSAPCTLPPDLLLYSGRPGYHRFVAEEIHAIVAAGGRFVACWGTLSSGPRELQDLLQKRRDDLLALLEGVEMWCLGTNADGSPRHPSRLGYETGMVRWR